MNDSPNPLYEKVVKEATAIGATLTRHRIDNALAIAGITQADLDSGVARIIRVCERHSECGGTGVTSRMVTEEGKGTRLHVALCPCLEIRMAKRITQETT